VYIGVGEDDLHRWTQWYSKMSPSNIRTVLDLAEGTIFALSPSWLGGTTGDIESAGAEWEIDKAGGEGVTRLRSNGRKRGNNCAASQRQLCLGAAAIADRVLELIGPTAFRSKTQYLPHRPRRPGRTLNNYKLIPFAEEGRGEKACLKNNIGLDTWRREYRMAHLAPKLPLKGSPRDLLFLDSRSNEEAVSSLQTLEYHTSPKITGEPCTEGSKYAFFVDTNFVRPGYSRVPVHSPAPWWSYLIAAEGDPEQNSDFYYSM
jgi:hypothetical protein